MRAKSFGTSLGHPAKIMTVAVARILWVVAAGDRIHHFRQRPHLS